jgi:DNA-binding LacI/PurR family transcriptional regulator
LRLRAGIELDLSWKAGKAVSQVFQEAGERNMAAAGGLTSAGIRLETAEAVIEPQSGGPVDQSVAPGAEWQLNRKSKGQKARVATIDEVALKAGVSIATVSRTLRNSTLVREKTRDRVLRVVEELRYRPNLNACALAGGAARLVGVIVPNIANPFFCDIYKAISGAMEIRGFDVVLKTTEYREEQLLDRVRQMIGRRVAGLVLAGSGISENIATELKGSQFPTICHGAEGTTVDRCSDSSRGIRQLVGYLRDLGHRKLGILEYFSPSSWADPRIAALRSVLARTSGLDCRTAVVPDTLEGGRSAFHTLLSGHFRPTALIAAHDVMAIGAMHAAREQGYRVPQDISVAGLDNIALSRFSDPTLTTVHIERYRVAIELYGSLFPKLPPPAADGAFANMDCELIVRKSTAAPNSGF